MKIKKLINWLKIDDNWKQFEKILRGIEVLSVFLAALFAIFIGLKQNSINQALIDLSYEPSVSVVYDSQSDSQSARLIVYNRGDKEVSASDVVWQDKFDTSTYKLSNELRGIAPGDNYYYFANDLPATIDKYVKEIGQDGERFIPFEVHLMSLSQRKYVAKCLLLIKVDNSVVSVHTQTSAIIPSDW